MRYQQLWSRVLVLAIVLLSNFLIAASARAAIDDVPYASDPEAPLTDAQWRQLAAKHQLQMVARTESPKKATAKPNGEQIAANQDYWTARQVSDGYLFGYRAWTYGQSIFWYGDYNVITSHSRNIMWEGRSPIYTLSNPSIISWEQGGDGWEFLEAKQQGDISDCGTDLPCLLSPSRCRSAEIRPASLGRALSCGKVVVAAGSDGKGGGEGGGDDAAVCLAR